MISIHAPREGSDVRPAESSDHSAISIHAPREGSDAGTYLHCNLSFPWISIHTPREGSDDRATAPDSERMVNFNPHSP